MTNYGDDDTGYVDVVRDQYGRTHITLDDSVMDLFTEYLFRHGDLEGPILDIANGLAVAQDEMHETK